MADRVIFRRYIESHDVRLNRHVHHDSMSKLYPFPTDGLTIQTVRHQRHGAVLDQGNLGSCTGNAGIGDLMTDPCAGTTNSPRYTLDETGAVQLYSDATAADGYPGQYPPDDTGSDGLTIAKVLKKSGLISGYQHTFTIDDALKALSQYPLMVGTQWMNSMFNPDANGVLTVDKGSGVAGGHEYVVDEYDATRDMVGFTNSWGNGWGLAGRAYMKADDLGWLLEQQGDVIVLLPTTVPAPPSPTPPSPPSPIVVDDADRKLIPVAKIWVNESALGEIIHEHKMRVALREWLAAKSA
jgi:hypothetical protein